MEWLTQRVESSFLGANKSGDNSKRAVIKGSIIIALVTTLVTILPFVILQILNLGVIKTYETATESGMILDFGGHNGLYYLFIALNSSVVGLGLGTLLAEKLAHKRSMSKMFSYDRFNVSKLIFGFTAWMFLAVLASLIDVWIFKSEYVLTNNFKTVLIFLPLVLVVTPLQCIAEELFFRTYLMRLVYSKTNVTVRFLAIITIIFALVHLPNMALMSGSSFFIFILSLVMYLIISLLLTYVTYKSNGLEVAIGIHSANNILSFVMFNSVASYLGFVPSFFDVKTTNIYWGVASLILVSLVIVWTYSKIEKNCFLKVHNIHSFQEFVNTC